MTPLGGGHSCHCLDCEILGRMKKATPLDALHEERLSFPHNHMISTHPSHIIPSMATFSDE